jgi:pyrroline-5-carboxylate reductase
VSVCNRTPAKAEDLVRALPGLKLCRSPAEVLGACDPIFLWTKPPDATQVLENNRELISGRQPLIVSCIAGVPLSRFTPRWAESLPNVAMAVGRGVTLVNFPPGLADTDRATVRDLLGLVGTVHEIPAAEIPYYTALMSCGPALYAVMLEQFADTLAARRGYDRDLCRRMVHETMAGTLALQEEDGIDAAEVVRRVAHPGGSTEGGLVVLREALPALYERMLQGMRKW